MIRLRRENPCLSVVVAQEWRRPRQLTPPVPIAFLLAAVLLSTLSIPPYSTAQPPFVSFAVAGVVFTKRCLSGDTFASYADAAGRCTGGEFLAAPRNAFELRTLNQNYSSVFASSFVVGASLTGLDAWRWAAGPSAGMVFQLGSAALNPEFSFVSGTLLTGSAGSRFMVYQSGWTTVTSLSGFQCSLCQSYTDCGDVCNQDGTESVPVGHSAWGGCVCVCKPGYKGTYCDYQTELVCTGSQVTQQAARTACAAKGGYLAAPTTASIMAELRAQYNLTSETNVMIDGSDATVEGQWLWTQGPDAGKQFWQGNSTGVSVNGYTSYFSSGEPNNYAHSSGRENILCLKNYKWNDCNVEGNDVRCYVCQYSACNASSPCVAANTLSASGTDFSDCSCNCKAGYGGKYCQCPTNGCSPIGGDIVQEPTRCSCVCKPNYNGVNCSERTATPALTASPSLSITAETPSQKVSQSLGITCSKNESTSSFSAAETLSTSPLLRTQTDSFSGTHSDTRTRTQNDGVSFTVSLFLTHSRSASEASSTARKSLSGPTTLSASTTQSTSKEETRSCGDMVWRSACEILSWQLVVVAANNASLDANTSSNASSLPANMTSSFDPDCVPTVNIPYAVWSAGDVRLWASFPPSRLLPRALPPPNASFAGTAPPPAPLVSLPDLVQFANSGGKQLEVILKSREEEATLNERAHSIALPDWLFSCGIPFPLATTVVYEARPRSTAVKDVQDATTGVGAASSLMTGSPGAVVRGGMLSTISALMRCGDFDPYGEVGWLNNPFDFTSGPADGAYLRGSVVSGIVVVLMGGFIGATIVVSSLAWLWCSGRPILSAKEIAAQGRLPSSIVALVALGMEVGTGSAMSLLSMDSSYGNAGDRVGGFICIAIAAAYCFHVAYSCVNAPMHAVPVHSLPERSGPMRRALRYLFQPTHELHIKDSPDGNNDTDSLLSVREWVRRNAFYTADLKWPLFRGIELSLGLVSNLVEGFAASSKVACISRIVLMVVVLAGIVALLIKTQACAIRAMLWSTVLVNVVMAIAAVMALVNVVLASPSIEDAADWLLLGASLIIGVQSALDIVLTAVTVIPATRSLFVFLRQRFGEEGAGKGGKKPRRVISDDLFSDEKMVGIAVPLNSHELSDSSLSEENNQDDEALSPDDAEYVARVSRYVATAPLEHDRRGGVEETDVNTQVESAFEEYMRERSRSSTPLYEQDGDEYASLENGDQDELSGAPPLEEKLKGSDDPIQDEESDDDVPAEFLTFLNSKGFAVRLERGEDISGDGDGEHRDSNERY